VAVHIDSLVTNVTKLSLSYRNRKRSAEPETSTPDFSVRLRIRSTILSRSTTHRCEYSEVGERASKFPTLSNATVRPSSHLLWYANGGDGKNDVFDKDKD